MNQTEMKFTMEQIHDAFSRVKGGQDFPQFVQDLKLLGVTHYDNYVSDGRTIYYGANNFTVNSEAKYGQKPVDSVASAEKLKHALSIHQQGQTDYPTFCDQAAAAGVEKWTTNMIEMTVTYYDKEGNKMVVENIPQVK